MARYRVETNDFEIAAHRVSLAEAALIVGRTESSLAQDVNQYGEAGAEQFVVFEVPEKSARSLARSRDHKQYNALVLKSFDDLEYADRREMLDRKAEVQIAARRRL